jgi:hypothetical protein
MLRFAGELYLRFFDQDGIGNDLYYFLAGLVVRYPHHIERNCTLAKNLLRRVVEYGTNGCGIRLAL